MLTEKKKKGKKIAIHSYKSGWSHNTNTVQAIWHATEMKAAVAGQ